MAKYERYNLSPGWEAQGMGAKLIDLGGGDVGMMFTPNGKKVKT